MDGVSVVGGPGGGGYMSTAEHHGVMMRLTLWGRLPTQTQHPSLADNLLGDVLDAMAWGVWKNVSAAWEPRTGAVGTEAGEWASKAVHQLHWQGGV